MASTSAAAKRPRARDFGVSFEGTPGPLNAITDVAGITVGFSTIIEGSGALHVGKGPVRTGVTAILPRGNESSDPVFAGWFPLNGNGEMTGTAWIDESGFLEGPIMLTNTHSVGVVRDAVVEWQVRNGKLFQPYSYPIVAETYDGYLNDINGFHVKPHHALAALEGARSGPVAEGNVGGGTGMVCFAFKGGTGTASRRCGEADAYTVGVLVQANFGTRSQLMISGVPIGKEIPRAEPLVFAAHNALPQREQGSIIVVVATDAPLLPHQLKRVVRRTALGLARVGGGAGNGSGDIMVAFSTANAGAASSTPVGAVHMLANAQITSVFDATIFATEEAIINALFAGETVTGVDDRTIEELPAERVREVLMRYQRI